MFWGGLGCFNGPELGRRFSLPHSCFLSLSLSISRRPVILNSFFSFFRSCVRCVF